MGDSIFEYANSLVVPYQLLNVTRSRLIVAFSNFQPHSCPGSSQTFYLVASTNDESLYKILEIDRKEPKDLVWRDTGQVFNSVTVRDYLGRLAVEHGLQRKTGLYEKATAFGVVGALTVCNPGNCR